MHDVSSTPSTKIEREPDKTPRSVSVLLATGLGLGLVAPAPGTIGTAVWGLPYAWLIAQVPTPGWQITIIAVVFAIGIPLTTFANAALGVEKDHQAIIWDEVATLPIVFLAVPMVNWRIAIVGFLLHRFFDIFKPPPAAQFERLPEGLGIMSDDLMAAVYACLALIGIAWLDHELGRVLLSMPMG